MYYLPRTLEEATRALAESGGAILAGGTDFYPLAGERTQFGPVVDISHIPELRGIDIAPATIRIGACTTWSELLAAPLPRSCDGLKAAAASIGARQIQNLGTVGGNLCNASPAADAVPPLLALDAEVELVSAAGRRRIPLDGFFTGYRRTAKAPDEVLAAVILPRGIDDGRSAFLKLGARQYLVISIAMVAVVVAAEAGRVRDARVAVGACSVFARRLPALERDLIGRDLAGLGAAAMPAHLGDLQPIDDVRASADYRRQAALELVRRGLADCAAGYAS